MDHIPGRSWTSSADTSELHIAPTFPGDVTALITACAEGKCADMTLSADQLAEKITDEIRRLALMRGRQAAVEAAAAADNPACTCAPLPSYDGPEVDCPTHGIDVETVRWLHANGLCSVRTPQEAVAARAGGLRATESPDAPGARTATPGTGDDERVPLRDRGAKSTTMWTRRNSSSGNFGRSGAEGADIPTAGGSTPGTGDEPHHGPASHPEPVRLLDVTPTGTRREQRCGDALTDAMIAAMHAALWYTPQPPGVLRCSCGDQTWNARVLLRGGAWTNPLAAHYVAWHRSEIPADELKRVARHLGVDLP